jgi:pimeloyl-ACP methyl ester carboxylesterase
MDGVTHRYIDVLGARMHVAEAGEGSPVVLLHGWPQHCWSEEELDCYPQSFRPPDPTRVPHPTCTGAS